MSEASLLRTVPEPLEPEARSSGEDTRREDVERVVDVERLRAESVVRGAGRRAPGEVLRERGRPGGEELLHDEDREAVGQPGEATPEGGDGRRGASRRGGERGRPRGVPEDALELVGGERAEDVAELRGVDLRGEGPARREAARAGRRHARAEDLELLLREGRLGHEVLLRVEPRSEGPRGDRRLGRGAGRVRAGG